MKILLFGLILATLVFGDNLSLRLQKLINDKSEKRVEILKYDPFFTKNEIAKTYKKDHNLKQKIKKPKKRVLRLTAIMGSKAFVDGRWIQRDDMIDGYKVKKVLKNSVLLYKKRKISILKFEKRTEILKVREK